jgi:hypothetical protein
MDAIGHELGEGGGAVDVHDGMLVTGRTSRRNNESRTPVVCIVVALGYMLHRYSVRGGSRIARRIVTSTLAFHLARTPAIEGLKNGLDGLVAGFVARAVRPMRRPSDLNPFLSMQSQR